MGAVCIIEKDKTELLALKQFVIEAGHTPITFHNDILLTSAALRGADVAVISMDQDVGNGLALAKRLKRQYPNIRIILSSALDITPFEDRILTAVDVLLLSPFSRTEFQCLINTLIKS